VFRFSNAVFSIFIKSLYGVIFLVQFPWQRILGAKNNFFANFTNNKYLNILFQEPYPSENGFDVDYYSREESFLYFPPFLLPRKLV